MRVLGDVEISPEVDIEVFKATAGDRWMLCSDGLFKAVPEAEIAKRRAAWKAPAPALDSGYWKLYIDHVTQADEGADLDFLRGKRGSFVPKDNH